MTFGATLFAIGTLHVCAASSAAQPGPDYSPEWLSLPKSKDFAKVFPRRAQFEKQNGLVRLKCTIIKETGLLENCTVTSEMPSGYGFGEAALKLVPFFKLGRLETTAERATINIPITFAN